MILAVGENNIDKVTRKRSVTAQDKYGKNEVRQ